MKFIFSFYFFFSTITLLSQNSLGEVLNSLSAINNEVKVTISKSIKAEFKIGKSDINELRKNKIFELIINNRRKFSLVPLANNIDFIVYTLIPDYYLINELDTHYNGVHNVYLLYDKKNKRLLCVESKLPGYTYKTQKNNIIIGYSFSEIQSKIIELDSNLKPISAVSYSSDENGNSFQNLFLCNYELDKLSLKKIKYESKDSSIFSIPYKKLIDFLAKRPNGYDSISEIEENNQFSSIFFYTEQKYY